MLHSAPLQLAAALIQAVTTRRMDMGMFEDFINDCIADCIEGDSGTPLRVDHEAEYSREEFEARERYKCCSPRCPGYSFRASDRPHPLDTCAEREGDFAPRKQTCNAPECCCDKCWAKLDEVQP